MGFQMWFQAYSNDFYPGFHANLKSEGKNQNDSTFGHFPCKILEKSAKLLRFVFGPHILKLGQNLYT